MGRHPVTEKTWPTETAEDIVERTRRDHGDAAADIVAKAICAPAQPYRKPPPTMVGVKPKPARGIPRPAPQGLTRAEATEIWKDSFQRDTAARAGRPGFGRTGLPPSGAGLPKATS